MQVVSITEARNNFKHIFDTVFMDKEEIIIHRKGKENIAIIPIEEYNSLKETNYLLSNPNNKKYLLDSIKQIENGEIITNAIDL